MSLNPVGDHTDPTRVARRKINKTINLRENFKFTLIEVCIMFQNDGIGVKSFYNQD